MREDLTKLRAFQQKHALVSNYSVNKDTSSARLSGWYIYMYYKYWYILTHTYWGESRHFICQTNRKYSYTVLMIYLSRSLSIWTITVNQPLFVSENQTLSYSCNTTWDLHAKITHPNQFITSKSWNNVVMNYWWCWLKA